MRLIPLALIAGAAALMGAAAWAAEPVERSGNTFHVAVCARSIPVRTARCHAHVVTDRTGKPLVNQNRGGGGGTPSGYGPADLQSAYNIVQTVNPLSTPTGPVVAIVDAYGYSNAESNLGTYRSQYKLPPCTTANGCFRKINQTGGTTYPSNNTGWDQEQALDIEMISAACPNCRILLVEANTANFGDLAAAVSEAAVYAFPDGAHAHAISNSYGGAESGSQPYEPNYNQAAVGVAVTASTGDSGYGAGPQFPATSPHVNAVGGTSLTRVTGGRGWSETAWSSAGSGCSTVYARQSWQAFISIAGCTGRVEGDTSAVADPNTGVAVYGPVFGPFSGWLVFGGTSVSSPLTAAIYGLRNDAVATGTSNPYNSTASALNDVTSGNNGSCGGTAVCTAGPGYDGPTGLGTPNGSTAF